MNIEILPVNATNLAVYSRIPISFEIKSKLNVTLVDRGLGGMVFEEQEVTPPYVKDYDRMEGEEPTLWGKRFDVSNWILALARRDGLLVGGATVAWHTPGFDLLERRQDLAVLWDIRVVPEHQRTGVGTELIGAVAKWASDRRCTQLKIETQNTNVSACRFYVRQGCTLGEVHRYKYFGNPETSDEVMLVWYLGLKQSSALK